MLPKNIMIQDTPQILLSASYIREQIKNKFSIKYLVPEKVEQYLADSGLYK
jgi:nicotinate-nucleotide adenylyltransferase